MVCKQGEARSDLLIRERKERLVMQQANEVESLAPLQALHACLTLHQQEYFTEFLRIRLDKHVLPH